MIAESTGLSVRKGKTKVIGANNKQENKIKLNGEDLEDVERVSYLDSAITVTRGAEEDVKSRLDEARVAFNTVRPVWNAPSISTKTEMRIIQVKAALLHGSETRKVTQAL